MTTKWIDFREVKEKIRMIDVCRKLGIGDEFKQRGDEWRGVCPLPSHRHGDRPNPRQFVITVKPTGDLWHCFGDCGRGGDAIELIKEIAALDNVGVRDWLVEHFRDQLAADRPETDETNPTDQTTTAVEDAATELVPLDFYLDLGAERGREYLESRGISVETAEHFGVGYAKRGMMRDRVCFPIYRPDATADENPCAYCGRSVHDDVDPKYLWPKGFRKGHILFGVSQARAGSAPNQPWAIVEGPFSVLALHQHGIPAVCTFGAQLSGEQAALIAAEHRPIWICYDPDDAGFQGAKQAKEVLIGAGCQFVSIVSLPGQPDTIAGEIIKRLLNI